VTVLDPERLRARLEDLFPESAGAGECAVARAPGRINVIGEHTDYNDGFVLPAAIGLETWIAFVPTADRRVELALDATGEVAGFDLDALPARIESWVDYPMGVAWSLTELGYALRGLRGVVTGTLPISAGMSSSAALEVAAALAMAPEPPEPMALVRACQSAENSWVGVDCGIMDQFAVRFGEAGRGLLLDCRTLDYRPVRLPLSDYAFVVCDTRSPRRLSGSAYNTRRRECEAAVRQMAALEPKIRALRDVDPDLLERARPSLDLVSYRRARHVVDENARVLAAVTALEANDADEVGRLIDASHVSLRDLFEVSSPELDALVEIAQSVPGVAGCRMMGGGFGGSTLTMVSRRAVDDLRAAVDREYPRRTGLQPAVRVVEVVDGAGMLAI
jgi:galactokinase